jgi:hypothetical protein
MSSTAGLTFIVHEMYGAKRTATVHDYLLFYCIKSAIGAQRIP